MQVMALSSHAAWASFLTVRRVASVAVRRSTADAFTRRLSNQPASNGTPGLRSPCAAEPRCNAMTDSGKEGLSDIVTT
jgi:hypothetical protein